jgi:hypothetical protein
VLRFAALDLTGYQVRAALETPDGVKHTIACDLLSANPSESFVRLSLTARVYASMPKRLITVDCPWDLLLVPPVGEPIPVARGTARLVRPIANVD